jgi:hypothetical protein
MTLTSNLNEKYNQGSQLTSVSCLGFCKKTQKHKPSYSGNCYRRYKATMTPEQEQYVFKHLSLIDMERTQRSIEKVEISDDEYIKEALFRDAVVSYIRPFSGNRGEHVKRGLKLKQDGIPENLKSVHKEIEDIRNQLFAHNDLEYQNVQFGPETSFSVKGYEKVFFCHLAEPLKQLAEAIHKKLMQEMLEQREKGL